MAARTIAQKPRESTGGTRPEVRDARGCAGCAVNLLPTVLLLTWTDKMAGSAGNGAPFGKRWTGPSAQPPASRAAEDSDGPDVSHPGQHSHAVDPDAAAGRPHGRGAPTPVSLPAIAGSTSTRASDELPGPPMSRADAALDGTLASYLERVANRTAAVFNVAAVAIALVGDDRRMLRRRVSATGVGRAIPAP